MLSSSDSSGDEGKRQPKLKINQKFAKQYEDKKRFQDLQRNQELLGGLDDSGSETESSSEDEDAVGLSTALDFEIMKTISSIKNKDPKIYEKSTKFYSQSNDHGSDDSSSDEEEEQTKKGKKEKRKTYKDVVREQLLSGKADSSDDDKQADETYYDKEKSLAYDQEQEQIRQKFLSSAMNSDDSSEDDEMMAVKPKSAQEQAEEEARLQAAIEEVASLNKQDTNLEASEEAFLANYMKQKKWMDDADLKVDKKTKGVMSKESEDELLDLEEDEEELYEVDKFESKYNFRFEEEQQGGGGIVGAGGTGEVIGHARNVEGSLRRVDDKRKKQREERKERKEKERRVKEAELRRLKNLKREELKSRLRQIEEVCGVKGLVVDDSQEEDAPASPETDKKKKKKKDKEKDKSKKKAGINVMDLDEDWDPEKHEALMRSQFNDDYYNQDDPDFAPGGKFYDPAAEDDVGEGYSTVGGWNEEYDEDDDEYHGGAGDTAGYGQVEEGEEGELGNAEMDAELYKLDYEDIVAGIPCRFKYTTVEAEDFGLTIDDILDAQDNELNKFVGLKKISASYREARKAEDQETKLSRKRKHLREAIKQRRIEAEEKSKAKRLEDDLAEAESKKTSKNVTEGQEDESGKKSKRKRSKKKIIGGNILSSPDVVGVVKSSDSAASAEKNKPKRKHKRGKTEVSDKDAAKKRRMELYE